MYTKFVCTLSVWLTLGVKKLHNFNNLPWKYMKNIYVNTTTLWNVTVLYFKDQGTCVCIVTWTSSRPLIPSKTSNNLSLALVSQHCLKLCLITSAKLCSKSFKKNSCNRVLKYGVTKNGFQKLWDLVRFVERVLQTMSTWENLTTCCN